ncbi:MAG TPA: TauD/TfdA family dioxygenase [Bryobacteraceae bacterium]|nr:TauD/TfdA family dioxygenase [Bryobacteraceae bacterium]
MRLDEETRRELPAAVERSAKEGGFPLPSFAPMAAEIRRRLREGRGFVVLRGIDLDQFSEEQARLLYAGLGSQVGPILAQNLRGETLYSVRDEGIRMEAEYGRTGVRYSKTNSAFDFHTDSPSRVSGRTPDFIGLLVLRTAKTGGESALVSGYALHNVLRAERPDVLERLYRPFWVDRRAELPPGEEPVLPVPVFAFDGRLTVRYLRFYITKGQEWKGEPLDAADREALDVFDSVMRRPGVPVLVPLERGDIQIISNTFLLHSRAGYEDYADPALKRHYIRLWLADQAA